MAAANRVCTKCGQTKTVDQFGWSNKAKGWRRGKCKVCYNAASNQYKANNREAQQAYHQQYHQDHLEQERARSRQYYADNHEAINARQSTPEARAQQQQYRQDNREAIRLRMKQYYTDNREAINARQSTPEARAQQQQYREDNRDAIRAQQQQYYADNREAINARQSTPEARALRNAAAAVRSSTGEGKLLDAASQLHRLFYRGELGQVRLTRAEALIGCKRQQYRDWLASKFKAGMTHDNYGKGSGTWAPDHIIPKAAFKGEINDANLEIIYWWRNVQPLWEPENKAKGDYYTEQGKSNLIVNYNAWVAEGRPAP